MHRGFLALPACLPSVEACSQPGRGAVAALPCATRRARRRGFPRTRHAAHALTHPHSAACCLPPLIRYVAAAEAAAEVEAKDLSGALEGFKPIAKKGEWEGTPEAAHAGVGASGAEGALGAAPTPVLSSSHPPRLLTALDEEDTWLLGKKKGAKGKAKKGAPRLGCKGEQGPWQRFRGLAGPKAPRCCRAPARRKAALACTPAPPLPMLQRRRRRGLRSWCTAWTSWRRLPR